jgi:hypothetical protein
VKRLPWPAWLAIAIPIAALFGPVLLTDRSFAIRDAAHFYYPLFQWCSTEWSSGRVPLWNPYENCGLPVLADTTSSLFYPGKLIFLLPLDFALRYKLYVIGHVVIAAVTSYGLARRWKASQYAAAIAAIAYACGGNVVFQYSNAIFLVGAAWLPLAALAADQMLQARSWRAAILLGIVLALMILGGDPQMAYHALLITAIYALVLPFAAAPETRAAPKIHTLAKSVGLVGIAAVAGFVLAAVQILPSSEATKYSERAAFDAPRNIYELARAREPSAFDDASPPKSAFDGIFGTPPPGSHHFLAYDFSIGPWRLAEYVWPNVGGRMYPTYRRWFSLLPAEGRTWTPTLYCGLIPLLLALSAFRLRGDAARVHWLSWLVLLFTLASFGWYGVGWAVRETYALLGGDSSQLAIGAPVGGLYWLMVTFLPTYIYFRYPAKLLPLVSLGLSQLAAIGWDRMFSERRPKFARGLLALGGISGAAAFVIWCIGPRVFNRAIRPDHSLGPFDSAGAYHDLLSAFVHASVVALAALWLLKKAWSQLTGAPKWQLALILLTAVELAVANAWLVPTASSDLWRHESPVAAAIKFQAAATQIDVAIPPRYFRGSLSTWRPPQFAKAGSAERPAEMAQWEHDTLFPKYNLASGWSLVDSYGSIKLMDYESFFFVARQNGPQQADKSMLPQPTALRLLGAEFLLLPEAQKPEFAEQVVSDESPSNWPADSTLWRMKRTLPRAWIVHEVETLSPLPHPLSISAVDERTKAVLFPNHKARDFRRTAVVETDHPMAEWSSQNVPSEDAAADESCRIVRYEPQRVVIEAHLARPGLVVLSDAWFPGWQALVGPENGPQEVPIYRTNRVLRGVWLSAGNHTIDFCFRPPSFYRGAAVSALAWLALAIGALFVRFRWPPRPSVQIE